MENNNTPKTKRQLAAEQTQLKIKNTVINLMADKNFEQITIREICSIAGVSVGTFYLYFESKEAALLFSHKYLDDVFSRMDFSKCNCLLDEIFLITDKYIDSIMQESFQYIQQIYIAHIKCYSDYIFNENKQMAKILTTKINQAQISGEIKSTESAKELFRKIMINARGHIYDYCINPANSERVEWAERAKADIRCYAVNCCFGGR